MDINKYKLTSPVLLWLLVAIGGFVFWKLIPDGIFFDSGMIGALVLVLGIGNWFYVYFSTFRYHKKMFLSVNRIDSVVTEGLYAVVRHPLYIADVILGLSIFIYSPTYQILAVVLWASLVLWFWAGLEERMLEEKFMEDYKAYQTRVPMLIPKMEIVMKN